MFSRFFAKRNNAEGLLTSRLFNETTFYQAFVCDLQQCSNEVILESPFITSSKIDKLMSVLRRMGDRKVKITINRRNPLDHEDPFDMQVTSAIVSLQSMGIEVLFTGGHHRKLAIIDDRIL